MSAFRNDGEMSPELARSIDALKSRRRLMQPSQDLGERIAGATLELEARRVRSAAPRRSWTASRMAAGLAVLGVLGTLAWAVAALRGDPAVQATSVAATPAPAAARADEVVESLWPTDSVVVRMAAVQTPAGLVFDRKSTASGVPEGSRYWVDVSVANDGAMRIVRVMPAGI